MRVDKATQIARYQPALASSFGKGLGTGTPSSIVAKIAYEVTKDRHLKNQGILDQFILKRKLSIMTEEKPSVAVGLDHLSKRLRQMRGFDPSSDNDPQFGDLNELGLFIRVASKELSHHHSLNMKKLVDALLLVLYGELARPILECPEKHLCCPRCKTQRAYVIDRDPRFVLCLSCGRQVLSEEAVYKVTKHAVDETYIKTVHRILALLKQSKEKTE